MFFSLCNSNSPNEVEQIIFHSSVKVPRTISITKTAKGATVKYYLDLSLEKRYALNVSKYTEHFSVELSMDEWLKFMNVLQELRIKEWKKEYGERKRLVTKEEWELKILSSNGNSFYSQGYDAYPTNWDKFIKTIYDVGRKKIIEMESQIETKLKAEYEKTNGTFLTDFELSIAYIDFLFKETDYINAKPDDCGTTSNSFASSCIQRETKDTYFRFSVTRTIKGARVEYCLSDDKTGKLEQIKAELNIDEWIAFIKTLSKYRINEWEKNYANDSRFGFNYNGQYYIPSNSWHLKIFSLDKEILASRGYTDNKHPPNWKEFRKLVDDTVKKAGSR